MVIIYLLKIYNESNENRSIFAKRNQTGHTDIQDVCYMNAMCIMVELS